jgi:hypothetical protein
MANDKKTVPKIENKTKLLAMVAMGCQALRICYFNLNMSVCFLRNESSLILLGKLIELSEIEIQIKHR